MDVNLFASDQLKSSWSDSDGADKYHRFVFIMIFGWYLIYAWFPKDFKASGYFHWFKIYKMNVTQDQFFKQSLTSFYLVFLLLDWSPYQG